MSMRRPARNELGIRCPQCGCLHFKTTHTEPLRDGRIRRRKICRHCGKKSVTFEVPPAARQGPKCYR